MIIFIARQEMNAKSQKLRKLWSTCNTLFSRVNYAQYYLNGNGLNNVANIDKGKQFSSLILF